MKAMVLLFAIIMMLTGCQSYVAMTQKDLEDKYVKKAQAEAQLRDAKTKFDKDLIEVQERISVAKDGVINAQEKQMQSAANSLYSINQAYAFFPKVGAFEYSKRETGLGFAALGKSPTIDEILNGPKKLQEYIDAFDKDNKDEIKRLQEENKKLLAEKGILVKTTEEAKQEVKQLQVQKEEIKETAAKQITVAQEKVNQANSEALASSAAAIAAEKERRESAEKLEKTKREIMIWCGIGAAIAMAGAVYSPVGKGGLAVISFVLAFVAVAIMYIQPWMVLTVGLVGAAAAIGYVLYRHNIAETSNDNMVNAIQDLKETSGETYGQVKKSLQEWNTKYKTNKSGEVVEVADKTIEKYIDQKLAEYGRLTTKKK